MGRLHNALGRQYENSASYQPKMYMPKNSQKVQLFYPGEKMAKVNSDQPINSIDEIAENGHVKKCILLNLVLFGYDE